MRLPPGGSAYFTAEVKSKNHNRELDTPFNAVSLKVPRELDGILVRGLPALCPRGHAPMVRVADMRDAVDAFRAKGAPGTIVP